MFAARGQENVVHARQTTAAAKPLNQGMRSLQPKTPGNINTPFRAFRNDENKNFTVAGQEPIQKNVSRDLNSNAFITPAGPRQRAPLGVKTTNAKAQPLKTPGFEQNTKPGKTIKKPSTARRSARKLIIAQPEPAKADSHKENIEDDEPDFGYAPPPIVELPDLPIDLDDDNYRTDYGEIYFGPQTEDDRLSLRRKREEESQHQRDTEDREFLERVKKDQASAKPDPDAAVDAMIAAGPRQSRMQVRHESQVSTLDAKSAAAALSRASTKLPSVAFKQTTSSMQKQNKTTVLPTHNRKQVPTHDRKTVPAAVSKNTIGFPKARQAPSIIPVGRQRKEIPSQKDQAMDSKRKQNELHPTEFVELYGEPPLDSEMWFRLKQHELLQQETDSLFPVHDVLSDELSDLDLFSPLTEDNDNFQLDIPEV